MDVPITKITVEELKQFLKEKTSDCLVLDCRPFLDFNKERINVSTNFFCPSILKRRFKSKGHLNIETMLSANTRIKLRSGAFTKLVIYDTLDIDLEHHECSEVDILIQALKVKKYSFKTVGILQGGFNRFKAAYPQMCTGYKSTTGPIQKGSEVSTPYIGAPNVGEEQKRFSKSEPTQLLPNLYIGDKNHSMDEKILHNLGITAILNVTASIKHDVSSSFAYKVLPIQDTVTENIAAWFGEAFSFIDSEQRKGGKILVHCRAGISRSATICIAYLMYHNALTLDQAFEYVRSKRSIISPNLNFMQQLLEFENSLLQKVRHMIANPITPRPRTPSKSPLPCSHSQENPKQGYFNFNFCTAVSQT